MIDNPQEEGVDLQNPLAMPFLPPSHTYVRITSDSWIGSCKILEKILMGRTRKYENPFFDGRHLKSPPNNI